MVDRDSEKFSKSNGKHIRVWGGFAFTAWGCLKRLGFGVVQALNLFRFGFV